MLTLGSIHGSHKNLSFVMENKLNLINGMNNISFLSATVGLVWALVVLIRRDMKLDALLGGGLLVIYFISLFLRLIQTLGSLQFQHMLLGLFFSR